MAKTLYGSLVVVDDLTANAAIAKTFDTDVAAAGVTLAGSTLAADGTDADIDINITPKGTGSAVISKADINSGSIDGTAIGASAASTAKFTAVDIDNINIDGNAIVSTDAAGSISITPDTTGDLILDGLKWPQADGTVGQVLKTDGSAQLSWVSGATGDVVGPAASTDNAIARFDLATGKLLQDSSVLIDDSNNMTGVVSLTATTVNATTFDTNVAAAAVTLAGVTLAADGNDADIPINVTPKGTGAVVISKVDIAAGEIDGTAIGANSASTAKFTALDVDNVNIDGNTIISSDVNGNLNLTPNGTGDLVLDGLKWPQADGSTGYVLKTDGSAQLSWVSNSVPKYSVFDADVNTAWGAAAGGYYTRTITAATHGMGTMPAVSIMEYDGTNCDVADVDRVRIIQANGNVEIRVPEAPEDRFRAAIFIY